MIIFICCLSVLSYKTTKALFTSKASNMNNTITAASTFSPFVLGLMSSSETKLSAPQSPSDNQDVEKETPTPNMTPLETITPTSTPVPQESITPTILLPTETLTPTPG